MHKSAAIFPGQGSQSVGMMKAFGHESSVQALYERASDILGYDVWQLTDQGPESKLNQTEFTQPALLVASMAMWGLWQETQQPMPTLLAGHSLGEYSALAASGALSFSDAVELVALRGRLMQEAVPDGTGAMAAVLGLDLSAIKKVCDEVAQGEVVAPANLNAPGQVVISGHRQAVERACDSLKAQGAKRAMLLPVSVPSHCALMTPASLKLAEALEAIEIHAPQIPVIHNCDMQTHTSAQGIKKALVEQLYRPVQWIGTVEKMVAQNIEQCIECGPGKVLAGLVKRIDKSVSVSPFQVPKGLENMTNE